MKLPLLAPMSQAISPGRRCRQITRNSALWSRSRAFSARLPASRTPLIGRDDALAALREALTKAGNLKEPRRVLTPAEMQEMTAAAFKDGEWPLDLKRLKVVGVVQDDLTRAVLQAAQADVPEE